MRAWSKEHHEEYVVTRFVKEAFAAGYIERLLLFHRASPPDPDFNAEGMWIEITMATEAADVRETVEFEKSEKSAMLLGGFGGRFERGASQPGRAWAADVIEAIKRKETKTIFSPLYDNRHLVIHPCFSNAKDLLFSPEHERTAFDFLHEAVASKRDELARAVNGCFIHALGKWYDCFDLLGKEQFVRVGLGG